MNKSLIVVAATKKRDRLATIARLAEKHRAGLAAIERLTADTESADGLSLAESLTPGEPDEP